MDLGRLRAMLRPPGPVIDVHCHPLPGPGRDATPREAADFLIAHADRAGVTKMVLMNIGRSWVREPDPATFRKDNDESLQIRDVAPDRFVSFCYVNPAFPDEAIAELDRCVGRHGMVGIKLWVAVRARDPRVRAIAEHAVKLDVPMLQHVWIKAGGNFPGESTPSDVAELARAVPHARIIMGHLNGAGLKGIEAVAAYPNVVVETGGSEPERGIVEAAVRSLGSRRVVFGSDVPGRHFSTQLGKVLGAELAEVTKRRILWDNLVRLLPRSAGLKPNGDDGPCPEDLRR
jgi:predicted TIM-barrel fold metal-dependent hydrolase